MIDPPMGFSCWEMHPFRGRLFQTLLFCCVLGLAAVLRFSGLDSRSLWGDEFCTWKVSQMPIAESLVWQPELTKPPIYQFAIRGVKTLRWQPSTPPSEWQLRLPAALCGVLAVLAMWWLGSIAAGWTLGASAALLFAVNGMQIDYSQEARPYSMLV